MATWAIATRITSLQLSQARLTNGAAAFLTRFSALTELSLAGNPEITDATLEWLDLTKLRSLSLGETSITDNGLKRLRGTRLKILALYGCKRITDVGMEHMSKLTTLTSLALDHTSVGDAGVTQLAPLVNLDQLSLGVTKCTEAALNIVSSLKKLRSLDLYGIPVSSAGLRKLRGLTELQTLRISDTAIDDEALRELATLTELRYLDLSRNPGITDAGLIHLNALIHLEYVDLQGTQVTAAGVAKLQKALPDCDIKWDDPHRKLAEWRLAVRCIYTMTAGG
ncbi:MAG: hypothetical protein CMJ64_29115 [Planctomycetaceae bacterium]|nr:hypothetical protein [Planctomycetaceae bacterium]